MTDSSGRSRRGPRLALALALLGLATAWAADAGAAARTTRPVRPTIRPTTASTPAPTTRPTVTAATAATVSTAGPARSTMTRVRATGRVNVFAAASLTASFSDIAAAFEAANPGASLSLTFAGSSTLVTQIRNGAPADVLATADTANMERLSAGGAVAGRPAAFTRNRLMIVVPKGNPLRVTTLRDLARPEVFVALGAPGVPAGDYAREVLARAGVEVTPRTLEPNVSAIVNKAALKEIDAGIVYVTDVALDDYRVDGIAIPSEQNVVAEYPIAVLKDASNPAAARAFVEFVRTAPAQAILRRYKFLPLT